MVHDLAGPYTGVLGSPGMFGPLVEASEARLREAFPEMAEKAAAACKADAEARKSYVELHVDAFLATIRRMGVPDDILAGLRQKFMEEILGKE